MSIVITHEVRLSADTLAAVSELTLAIRAAGMNHRMAVTELAKALASIAPQEFARATLAAATERPGPHQQTDDDRRAFSAAGVVSAGDTATPTPEAPPVVTAAVPPAVTRFEPEAPAPAAEPAAGSVAGGHTWKPSWSTPERDAKLAELYPADADKNTIMMALSALPGPPVGEWSSVRNYASQVLKVHRTGANRLRAARPAVPPSQPGTKRPAIASMNDIPSVAARELAEADRERAAGVPMDLDAALEWGRRQKIVFSGDANKDFKAVNETRIANGLPPYRLVMPRGRPEPLPAEHLGGR